MKKILHLFRIEKFTEGFIELMNSGGIFNNTFWVYGENDLYEQCKSTYLREINVKYYPRIDIELNKSSTEKQMKMFDLIVYHGVFEICVIDFFFRHKFLLKKLALYFWGGDKKLFDDWKDRVKKKYVVKNAAAIITIIPQDYLGIKQIYHPKGKHFCVEYFDNETQNILNMLQHLPQKEKEVINIQIGNSATETNNHIEVLDMLKTFKDRNIRIFVPLSYGSLEYAKKVIKYGKNIFGDKFVPMRKFMTLKEYCFFVRDMDIGIFNISRQQAFGNIYLLMQFGCKIFIKRNSLIGEYLVNDLKCIVTDISDIEKVPFEQFFYFSEEDKQKNKELMCENFSKENSLKKWENIFGILVDYIL